MNDASRDNHCDDDAGVVGEAEDSCYTYLVSIVFQLNRIEAQFGRHSFKK